MNPEEQHLKDLERIKNFRLLDDDFMTKVFDGSIEETQLVLRKNVDPAMLPEVYIIFITENDVLKKGLPLYHIERIIKETGEEFGDEEHIIYVNGAYQGDDQIGYLMNDFRESDPSRMHYPLLAERTRYFKETEEGRNAMCKVIEDMRNESYQEGRQEGILEKAKEVYQALLDEGMTPEKALQLSKLKEAEAAVVTVA